MDTLISILQALFEDKRYKIKKEDIPTIIFNSFIVLIMGLIFYLIILISNNY